MGACHKCTPEPTARKVGNITAWLAIKAPKMQREGCEPLLAIIGTQTTRAILKPSGRP
jgi:hypothetical protein